MFHHTKVAQPKPPKPHLRLHVSEAMKDGRMQPCGWLVTRVETGEAAGSRASAVYERTQWWPTSKLALDAAYYQFSCTWPAGRP